MQALPWWRGGGLMGPNRLETVLMVLGTALLFGFACLGPPYLRNLTAIAGVVAGSGGFIAWFFRYKKEDKKRESERRASREIAKLMIRHRQGECLDCLMQEWFIREGIVPPGTAAPPHSCSESHGGAGWKN